MYFKLNNHALFSVFIISTTRSVAVTIRTHSFFIGLTLQFYPRCILMRFYESHKTALTECITETHCVL